AQRSGAACSGEHNFCWPDKKTMKKNGDVWAYNNQSKSGLFAQGEASEINVIAYAETEYMISFCTSEEMIEGKIQFKIYDFVSKSIREKKVVKKEVEDFDHPNEDGSFPKVMVNDTTYSIKYEKSRKLIYDNTKKNNAQTYSFISDKTRKLLVEVFVPDGGAKASETGEELDAATYACLGMLVLHQKAIRTGLNK
ncbi:MAG: hypothetical protein ACHQF2_06455, partial [Flavobacteriales bacterium]